MITNIDYVEFYVEDAPKAAKTFCDAFGFNVIGYCGPETGSYDRVSFLLNMAAITFAVTSALDSHGPVANHVRTHGDGVKDIAFGVDDVVETYNESIRHGARPVLAPQVVSEHGQTFVKATIAAYGDTAHSFIQRENMSTWCLPGYSVADQPATRTHSGLIAIDHIACIVKKGEMDSLANFYANVLGLHESMKQQELSTAYSAMNVRVVQNQSRSIQLTMIEPVPEQPRCQLDEFLSLHHGPGVQHIAFLSNNIIETARFLRSRLELISAPLQYYDFIDEHPDPLDESVQALRDLGIFVDRADRGYLLQAFTRPPLNRQTFFFELIQRKGAEGFGVGNIKALFDAVEEHRRKSPGEYFDQGRVRHIEGNAPLPPPYGPQEVDQGHC